MSDMFDRGFDPLAQMEAQQVQITMLTQNDHQLALAMNDQQQQLQHLNKLTKEMFELIKVQDQQIKLLQTRAVLEGI